jgi:hypothetical protein
LNPGASGLPKTATTPGFQGCAGGHLCRIELDNDQQVKYQIVISGLIR